VADKGAGISPEARTRLGEPFFTTKGQAGTGLGLWVTRSILNRYGGNLQLRSSVSEDGHGTVFRVFLPTNMRPLVVATGSYPRSTSTNGSQAARGAHARRPESDDSSGDPFVGPRGLAMLWRDYSSSSSC